MSKFGELTSSNLGVYAVETHSFCHNLTTIFVTLAFENGLEDRNFDISRLFCKLWKNGKVSCEENGDD